MNQASRPPEFQKKKSGSGKWIALALCTILCFGAAGIGGGYAAYTLASKQNTTTSSDSSKSQANTSKTQNRTNIEAVNVSSVVDQCRPTVVEITTEIASSGSNPFQQYVQQGAGSGVIMTSDGYIITNNHVIEGASTITVKTVDGSEYDAKLIGRDAQTDLAVIKIEANDLPAATFGNSNELKVGDIAIAIGNPLGSLGGTVTTGIISALNREITIENETMTLLQTDAAINPGNSGGGLFDEAGNLIGIVNAKQSSAGIEGLGFAIPISDAVEILDELVRNGTVTNRPALNVSLYDYTDTSLYGNSKYSDGVYIVQIIDGGAADQAGLKVNDQIIRFNGKDVSSTSEVKKELRSLKIGDRVPITVVRDGKEIETEITLSSNNQ